MIKEKGAKPFIKWAGGKTQLIETIKVALPYNIINKKFTYIEPFVGGGAILFWMLNNFPNLERAVINDINGDLTNSYLTIKNNVHGVIEQLEKWEKEYHSLLHNSVEKEKYFYDKRDLFNSRSSDAATHTALFIFLNRTCFNGLYRVNRKNLFNVPIGSYKAPMICDRDNLMAVSKALGKVEILNGDFAETINYATENSFFYFDPPYKPLNQTSSFNSYAKDEFNDESQIRLRDFCCELAAKGHNCMLSNSDVKGHNSEDEFFDELYCAHNIVRVGASNNTIISLSF